MTDPVKQTTYVPTRKIAAAAGIGLPLAVLIAWVLSLYEIKMPVEVAAALGSFLSSVIGYFVPDKQNLK